MNQPATGLLLLVASAPKWVVRGGNGVVSTGSV